MARLPYAAETLIAEARELWPDVTWEPSGDPDGFGVQRSIRFDTDTGQRLAEALEFLDDRRVPTVNLTDAGYLHVTFAPDSPEADDRDPFLLKDAVAVLHQDSQDESTGSEDPDPGEG